MADRTCPGCGVAFPADAHPNRKWCSKACGMRYRYRTDPAYREARRRSAKSARADGRPTEDRACEGCGVVRPVRLDKPTRYCRDCGRGVAARKRWARARRHWPSSPVAFPVCASCGVRFAVHGRGMRQRARCDECSTFSTSDGERRGWNLLVAGPCVWCGEGFVGLAASWKTRPLYCSDRCVRQAERSRNGRFSIPDSERQAIYERDGWVCQLCDDPVQRDLDPSDMWAATLDHIVPRSWTLVPDDRSENLRLAHRWCNSVRGDESYYSEDLLKVG